MFKNGMKILCRDQKDFDKISELAEKEGKKWPKPQIPRTVREGEIININGNYYRVIRAIETKFRKDTFLVSIRFRTGNGNNTRDHTTNDQRLP